MKLRYDEFPNFQMTSSQKHDLAPGSTKGVFKNEDKCLF